MDALFTIPSAALAMLEPGPTAGTTHAALRVTLACVLFLGLAAAIAHVRWRACRETMRDLHRLHGLEPLGCKADWPAAEAERIPPILPRRRAAAAGAEVR